MRGQAVKIKMKVIIPRRGINIIDALRMRRAINTALDMYAEDVRNDFLVTVDTWTHKPSWTIEAPKLKNWIGAYSRKIYTSSPIYAYVSGGTKVRRAVMSMDFRPKTRYRFIGSNKGQGGMVFVSKKITRPGIKAREFDKAIQAKWDKRYPTLLQDAINTEAHRQNHP